MCEKRGVKQKWEKEEGGEGVDKERKREMRRGVSWGSCHTSREMFQMVFLICCNGIMPFIGEPK